MKKSYLIITAAALLAAASCQKSDNAPASEVKYNPVEVVLSAAIEGVDTKVSYTEDANALKSAWVKDDAISLIAYDSDGKVLSNDIFTATTAGTTTKFSGTYSNPDGAVAVSVLYPALTVGSGSSSNAWRCESDVIYNVTLGDKYAHVAPNLNYQEANADPAFLAKSVVMRGKISDIPALVSSNVKATLKNTCYIVKATVTLPSTVSTVSEVRLVVSSPSSPSPSSSLTVCGWTHVDDNFMILYGGVATANYERIMTRLGGFAPASDGTVTAWMIGYTVDKFPIKSAETLTVSVDTDQGVLSRVKTIASDSAVESGKIYRLTVDMTK